MSLKKNVEQYNRDIEKVNSYGYSEDSNYSAFLANKRVTDTIIEYIQSYDSQIHTIIDIGCGDGTYTNKLKEKFPDKYIAGFDPAAKAIEVAKRKYPDVHFFVADAEEFILRDGEKQFDLAILSSVLHHTANPGEVIKTVSSYAVRILIIDPNGNNVVRKILEKTSSYYIEHEEVSYAPRIIKRWCENAGYKLNPIKHYGFVPLFFPTCLSKIIWFLTPTLEKIPIVTHYFGAISVISGFKQVGSDYHVKK